jgi:phosphatidylserine/phosphatidylglycerophosphate/cardiolipin synthase-like enzyme
MSEPLLALTSGELQRLSACVRALPEPPGDAALSQNQIASDRLELREALVTWLQEWNRLGGSNASLRLTIQLLLTQRQGQASGSAELVWSGPHGGAGDVTRDQAVVIREMVERCEQRLLITTFNIYRGGFIAELFDRIQRRLEVCPGLQARMVVNIPRPKGSTVLADQLRQAFVQKTWSQLWDLRRPRPSGYFDPRSLTLGRDRPAVFHVKCCVADSELLVTSANLSESAQYDNCELGLHFPNGGSSPGMSRAAAVWNHFDRLIHWQPPVLVPIEEPLSPPGPPGHADQ